MRYCGSIIKEGSTDQVAVKAIKIRLNTILGSTLDVTNGNFGASTKALVQQFQRKNLLIADGAVGELTWERLFTVILKEEPKSPILRIRALEIAKSYLYVREATGNNDGPEIEGFLKKLGFKKGTPWCQAGVYSWFDEGATELDVLNPVPKTASVLDCYNKAKGKYLVKGDPLPGDQFIMDFGGGKGHTGLVNEVKGSRIYTVEGNTSADPTYVGQDREGNGMFERVRSISGMKAFLRYE